jgi:hypothetical protein
MALALTAGADVSLAASFVRLAVVYPRVVPYPAILHEWAFAAARIGLWSATVAVPMSVASIGRARLIGLLAAIVAWLFGFLIVGIFAMY